MTVNPGAAIPFSDDRAVYCPAENCTFFTYISTSGTLDVVRVDDGTLLKTNLGALRSGYPVNDHYSGCGLLLPDGRIVWFYILPGGSDLAYRILTPSNNSLASEIQMGLPARVPGPYSYANAFYNSKSNRLLVLFQQCLPDGNTWAVASNFDQLATNTWPSVATLWGLGAGKASYLKACSNGVDRIDMLFTDGIPTDQVTSAYHVALVAVTPTLSQYHDSFGNDIATAANWPPNPTTATKVVDGATFGNSWIWQIDYDATGALVALLVTYPGNDQNNMRYRSARLGPSGWVSADICFAANRSLDDYSLTATIGRRYAPGICFDGDDARKVYAAIMDGTGSRVEEWVTTDFATWSLSRIVAPAELGADKKKFRPCSPKGYQPGGVALSYWYGPYTDIYDYNSALAVVTTPAAPNAIAVANANVQADASVPASVKAFAAAVTSFLHP